MKLRIFHVEHLDAGMVDVEKGEVIKLLQHKMARIKQNIASFVSTDSIEEHVER